MRENSFDFFQNRDCPYFPCHSGASEEDFNCLFCYCPLYMLGRECGGNFVYQPNGIKDCSNCTVPHSPGGYEHVIQKYELIVRRMRETDGGER